MIASEGSRRARPRIRDAALELMSRKGVAGTTTQDISRKAHCSQAAIYKHWEGKEALAQDIFQEAHRDLIQVMEDASREGQTQSQAVLNSLLALVQFARGRPRDYAFLFQVFHSDYARWLASLPKPRDLILHHVQGAMEAGEIPQGNASVKAALLLGMAVRLAFFERQALVDAEPGAATEELLQAAAAVLEN